MAILTTEGSSSPASQPIYKTLRANKLYNYLFTVAFSAVNLFLCYRSSEPHSKDTNLTARVETSG
jgi:hypothetical protein